ncbi:uncharacterized protein LOC128883088 isoform X2 [Hylaeus volcanicus]|uniref:uncharacterized protein LOC128883088 isoform X2 n=1 Tax=Hylaeus volcanicus TaxID=313075 RepID=UPI0023B81071|nr:uncharacterized protein LOC128883088 isoform X2 [Hylaeus volcanicus]
MSVELQISKCHQKHTIDSTSLQKKVSAETNKFEQCSTKSSPRSMDTPTPAMSRAFFIEQESLRSQQASLALSDPLNKSLDTLRAVSSTSNLHILCQLIASTENFENLDWGKFNVDTNGIIFDVKKHSGNMYTTLSVKLENFIHLLKRYTSGDGRTTKRVSLDDELLDEFLKQVILILYTIKITNGIWMLNGTEQKDLVSKADEVSVQMTELQPRLISYLKCKFKFLQHDPVAFLIELLPETFDKLIMWLTTLLGNAALVCSSFLSSPNHFEHLSNPVIRYLEPSYDTVFRKETVTIHQNDNTSTLTPVPTEYCIAYIQTIEIFESSIIMKKLFQTSEIQNALDALQGVKAGLQELALTQRFRCLSLIKQNNGFSTEIDRKIHESSMKKKQYTFNTIAFYASHNKELIQFISTHLNEVKRSLLGFFRVTGMLLGGGYDELRIQKELVHILVFGSYLSLVGFLFFHDLKNLNQWLLPYMPQLRQRLRARPAPKHSVYEKNVTRLHSEHYNCSPLKASPIATSLFDIFSNPQKISLTRQTESDQLLSLFVPHYHKSNIPSTSHNESVTPPAARIHSLLGWIVWEGDLLQLYHELNFILEPSSEKKQTLIVDALFNALLRGFSTIQDKFYSSFPSLFPKNSESVATSDILNFCHRMLECLTLCYLGEVELKACCKIVQNTLDLEDRAETPSIDHSFASSIALRAFSLNPENASSKINEGFPKLVWNLLHQSLFYASPLNSTMKPSISLTTVEASSLRITSLLTDIDRRLTSTQIKCDTSFMDIKNTDSAVASLEKKFNHLEGTISQNDYTVCNLSETHMPSEECLLNITAKEAKLSKLPSESEAKESLPFKGILITNKEKPSLEVLSDASDIFDKKSAEFIDATKKDILKLEEEIKTIRENLKQTEKTLTKDLIERTKQELSLYLRQTLSQTISNYVALALEKQKKPNVSRRRPLLLPWSSPHETWNRSTQRMSLGNLKHCSSPSKHDSNILKRNTRSENKKKEDLLLKNIWKGFDTDADTLSIMQEREKYDPNSCQEKISLFDSTTELLQMPDPRHSHNHPMFSQSDTQKSRASL